MSTEAKKAVVRTASLEPAESGEDRRVLLHQSGLSWSRHDDRFSGPL